jgi:hypothetical protein
MPSGLVNFCNPLMNLRPLKLPETVAEPKIVTLISDGLAPLN